MNPKLLLKLSLAALFLTGCSPELRKGLASASGAILGGRFGISSSDIDSALSAGEKLAEASRGFSPEQEYYIGRGVSANILSRFKVTKNDPAQRYLNSVGRSLAIHSDRPELYRGYRFSILESESINAVSAPSGFVFISVGFLKILEDEDQLAAVLAHEIAHVTLGHGISAISQSNVNSALSIVSKQVADRTASGVASQVVSTFGDSINEVTEKLLESGYSRSQEYDADKVAMVLMDRTGYSPVALQEVLNKLNSSDSNNEGWFSTHPKPSKRLYELEEALDGANDQDVTRFKGRKVRESRFKSRLKL